MVTVPAPVVGALVVSCPHCRATAGRPCVDSRGYLYEGGIHPSRRASWLDVEEADAARREREAAPAL